MYLVLVSLCIKVCSTVYMIVYKSTQKDAEKRQCISCVNCDIDICANWQHFFILPHNLSTCFYANYNTKCDAVLLMSYTIVCFTDQDPAMPAAIKVVFPDTIHRLCLWHVINKYQPLLNDLYARFEKLNLKEKFHSVIHHPLTPVEFESAWGMLLNEFELQGDGTLQSLYNIRHEWIPCFFKDEYCGTMTSTQRSESVNAIVKTCHVDANTPLHVFAKQMMRFIHRRKMDEATEDYRATVWLRLSPLSCSVLWSLIMLSNTVLPKI